MRFYDLTNEIAMNPAAFAQSLEQAESRGVLVGFEYEVCVPFSTILRSQVDMSDSANKISTLFNSGTAFRIPSKNNVQVFDKIFVPKNKIGPYENLTDYVTKTTDKVRQLLPKIYNDYKSRFSDQSRRSIKKIIKGINAGKTILDFDDRDLLYDIITLDRNNPKLKSDPTAQAEILDLYQALDDNRNWQKLWSNWINAVMGPSSLPSIIRFAQENFEVDPDSWDQYIARPYKDVLMYITDRTWKGMISKAIQSSLQKTIGMEVVVSSNKVMKKKPDKWYIEPDGSIDPDNGEDIGVEIVSPPLPAVTALDDMRKFYAMAKDLQLYTNTTTGFHINVSVPGSLDVLKLAIILGEDYVLQQFGREENDYVNRVIQDLKNEIANAAVISKPKMYKKDLNKFKPSISRINFNLLNKLLRNISSSHYASVSTEKKTYISFRHAGGDYLSDYSKTYNTVSRFIRAMVIASDPNAYRQDYLSKLTKLFSQVQVKPTSVLDLRAQGLPALKLYRFKSLYSSNQPLGRVVLSNLLNDLVVSSNMGSINDWYDFFDAANWKSSPLPQQEVEQRWQQLGIDPSKADRMSGYLIYPTTAEAVRSLLTLRPGTAKGYLPARGDYYRLDQVRLPVTDPLVQPLVKQLLQVYKK